MSVSKRMGFSTLTVSVIVFMSLIVAYISFNVLGSSAEVKLQNWKAGGAFASFIITASLLTSVVLQFYKTITSDKTEEYRDEIQELQSKLIKGAPCPEGYIIDLDERHKLVFARPGDWTPMKGIIYQYINKAGSNGFRENFNVIRYGREELSELYEHVASGGFDPGDIKEDELFGMILKVEEASFESCYSTFENYNVRKEYIKVDGIKSTKAFLTYTYSLAEGADKIKMCQVMVLTYVSRLCAVFQFTFSDSEEKFFKTSDVFNTVIESIRFL